MHRAQQQMSHFQPMENEPYLNFMDNASYAVCFLGSLENKCPFCSYQE